jgi:hypothetical protein
VNPDLSPAAIVQRQVDTYNRRDLDAFVATYSDRVQIFRMPSSEPAISGKEQLTAFYATQRFNLPHLHAEIVSRMVMGNKVIDHERITGLQAEPVEAVAVYEVADGLIQRVWFFYPQ